MKKSKKHSISTTEVKRKDVEAIANKYLNGKVVYLPAPIDKPVKGSLKGLLVAILLFYAAGATIYSLLRYLLWVSQR